MVAIEAIHFMKTKTQGNDGYVAIKLDVSKAYDRMDWDYLCQVMDKMGFDDKWIHWMSLCVEFMDYYVLVNGETIGPIITGRGLGQGDPLSPILIYYLCGWIFISYPRCGRKE